MDRNKYQRLPEEMKEFLKRLTLDGKSLNEISKITGLGKTTIYYQTKKLKVRQRKNFIIKLDDKQTGELIGAFAGDGSYYHNSNKKLYHHKVRYHFCLSKDLDYAKYIKQLLQKLNLNPFMIPIPAQNELNILVNSKDYIKFIKNFLEWEDNRTLSIRLKYPLDEYSNDFLVGFARALMDCEGFVEVSNVSCACISKNLIINLSNIFDKFGIRYKLSIRKREGNRKDLYLIRVYRNSLKDYNKIISFANKYKFDKLQKIIKNEDTEI